MPDKIKEEETENTIPVSGKDESKKTGHSGVFTSDGKELPEIEGGYSISGTGSDPDESDFVTA